MRGGFVSQAATDQQQDDKCVCKMKTHKEVPVQFISITTINGPQNNEVFWYVKFPSTKWKDFILTFEQLHPPATKCFNSSSRHLNNCHNTRQDNSLQGILLLTFMVLIINQKQTSLDRESGEKCGQALYLGKANNKMEQILSTQYFGKEK